MTAPKKLASVEALAKTHRKADLKVEKLAKDLAAAKKARDQLEETIRLGLVDANVASIRVAGYNFTPGERAILETKDWDAYWAWARKDRLGVYVQRRPAVTAVYEQLDAGKKVPGVLRGKLPTLYISKAAK